MKNVKKVQILKAAIAIAIAFSLVIPATAKFTPTKMVSNRGNNEFYFHPDDMSGSPGDDVTIRLMMNFDTPNPSNPNDRLSGYGFRCFYDSTVFDIANESFDWAGTAAETGGLPILVGPEVDTTLEEFGGAAASIICTPGVPMGEHVAMYIYNVHIADDASPGEYIFDLDDNGCTMADCNGADLDTSVVDGIFTIEGPILEYEPESHNFGTLIQGQTATTYFDIWNDGTSDLDFSLSETCDWVEVSPTSGTSSGPTDRVTIEVNIDTAGLSEGPHNCDIDITSNGGSGVFTVEVDVFVPEEPILAYDPESHDFGFMLEGQTDSEQFQIWNAGGQTLHYDLASTCDWVEVSPTSGSSDGEHDFITVSIDTTGLSVGPHSCDVEITSNGGSGTFTVYVTIVEDQPMPDLIISEFKATEMAKNIYELKATVENIGLADVESEFNVAFAGVSIIPGPNTMWRPIIVLLGTVQVEGLAAGESKMVKLKCSLNPGINLIIAYADSQHIIDELNETNNHAIIQLEPDIV